MCYPAAAAGLFFLTLAALLLYEARKLCLLAKEVWAVAKTKLACCGRRRGKRVSGAEGRAKGGDGDEGEGEGEVGAGRRRRPSAGGSKA